jgi:hypothetical protein
MADAPEIREALESATGPDEFIGWLAQFATKSNQRVAGIWRALEHAATEEPDVAAAFDQLIERQRSDARLGVEFLLGLAAQLPSPDLQQQADLLWAITLPDLYQRLVQEAGWALEDYTGFLERALRLALLG